VAGQDDPACGAEFDGAKAGVLYTVRALQSGQYPYLKSPDGADLPESFSSWKMRPAVGLRPSRTFYVDHAAFAAVCAQNRQGDAALAELEALEATSVQKQPQVPLGAQAAAAAEAELAELEAMMSA